MKFDIFAAGPTGCLVVDEVFRGRHAVTPSTYRLPLGLSLERNRRSAAPSQPDVSSPEFAK